MILYIPRKGNSINRKTCATRCTKRRLPAF
jgi:hypothetical protein